MKNKLETLPVKTEYSCPICKSPLFRQWGQQLHAGDKDFGVTLFCRNGDGNGRLHPQEVSGHGNCRANASDAVMIANAYAVIQAKFAGGKLPQVETEEIDLTEPTPEPVVVKAQPATRKPKKIKGLPVVESESDSDVI